MNIHGMNRSVDKVFQFAVAGLAVTNIRLLFKHLYLIQLFGLTLYAGG